MIYIFRDINEMGLLSFQCLTETSCATADFCFDYFISKIKNKIPKKFSQNIPQMRQDV